MKYSIIVPVYNTTSNYLQSCLDALIAQKRQDVEIIVIDDGSTEIDTLMTLNTYESNVKMIHQDNQGVAAARNTGVEVSSGQWVCFVDADDCLLPEALPSLDRILSASAQVPDIVVFDCFVNTNGHDEINHFYPQNKQFRWDNEMRENTLVEILGKNTYYNPPYIAMGVPWGKLYRKKYINQYNLHFPVGLSRMEDNIFNLYAFNSASNVSYCNLPLYRYTIVPNSASKTYSPDILGTFNRVNELTKEFLCQYVHNKRLRNAGLSRIVQELHAFIKFWIFNNENPTSYRQKKQVILSLIKQDPYYNAIHHLDFSITDKSVIMLSLLLRLHMIRVLSIAIAR